MAEKGCIKRLQKEFKALCKEPAPHVVARPLPNNILEWHYVLEGSEGTPFAGGYYHGKIKFPQDYPFSPPAISMTTPNGRFKTQTRICLSMSDFHPESWNPMWSVSSILTGLLSFMMDNSPTTGSVNTTVAEKQRLAEASLKYNCMNPTFRKIFPEYVEMYNKKQEEEEESRVSAAAAAAAGPSIEDDDGDDDDVKKTKKKKKEEDVLERLRGEAKNKNKRNTRNNNRKQPLPTWILLLLGSMFCVVMALPLLQL